MTWALRTAVAGAGFTLLAASADATPVTLDFDQINGDLAGQVGDFYNGGKSERGSGPGPDFGMTFLPIAPKSLSSAVVQCVDLNNCDQSNNVLKIFGDFENATESAGVDIHVAGGFRGTVEFDARMREGFAQIAMENGTPQSATNRVPFQTSAATPACIASISACPFEHFTFDVAGIFSPPDVIAHDLVFATFATGDVDIDNLHFSDVILPADTPPGDPSAVSEPASWMLMATGLGVLGVASRLPRLAYPRAQGGPAQKARRRRTPRLRPSSDRSARAAIAAV